MISSKNMLVFAVLGAGAVASWYLGRDHGPVDGGDAVVDSVHRGYYLKSARILGTGADGHPLYELRAEHAEQQGEDTVSFTDVQLNYSPQSDVPWSVIADTATLFGDRQRVILEGHVTALSSEGFSGNDTEIRTRVLEIDPENFVAETDERVQIRIGSRSLTATGMLASLKDNQVQLKSNVSGKFAP